MDSQKAMPSSPLDEKMKQIELKQNEFEYRDMSRLIALSGSISGPSGFYCIE